MDNKKQQKFLFWKVGHRTLSVFYISIFGRPRSITRYHFPRKFLSFYTVASTVNDSCSNVILIGTRIYRYSIQLTISSVLANKFIPPKQITGLLRHEAVNEASISITARIIYVYRVERVNSASSWNTRIPRLPSLWRSDMLKNCLSRGDVTCDESHPSQRVWERGERPHNTVWIPSFVGIELGWKVQSRKLPSCIT